MALHDQMRRPGRLVFTLTALLLACGNAAAAEATRMGFVDMPRIIAVSTDVRDARARAERDTESARTKLEAEARAIMKMQEDLKRDEAILSESQRNAKQNELKERAQAYQKMSAEMQKDISRKQNEYAEKAMQPVNKALAEVAKEAGVNAVFERSKSALLYVDDAMDLTDRVIKRLQASQGR